MIPGLCGSVVEGWPSHQRVEGLVPSQGLISGLQVNPRPTQVRVQVNPRPTQVRVQVNPRPTQVRVFGEATY